MSEETCVLVCGIGEIASAIARRLFAEDRAVAIHQGPPPRTLRRRMAFSDAWFDGAATLDGVEARRADLSSEFLLGLRTRQFIPVLTQRFADVTERWPWDVVVAVAPDDSSPPDHVKDHADLTIGVGGVFFAGENCDVVIATEGPDPGAIFHKGAAPSNGRPTNAAFEETCQLFAPTSGVFQTTQTIGGRIETGEVLGVVGRSAIRSSVSGRIRGLIRRGQAVVTGTAVVDIATSSAAPVAGITHRNQLIARGVAFAVEMESHGRGPASFEQWL